MVNCSYIFMESSLLKDILGMYSVQRQALNVSVFVSYRHNFLVFLIYSRVQSCQVTLSIAFTLLNGFMYKLSQL